MMGLIDKFLGKSAEKQVDIAGAWMHDLEEMSEINALTLCTKKLVSIIEDETLSTLQKTDLILELETLNQARLAKLESQFAHLARLKPELETSIYDTSYTYHRQSYIFHLKLLEQIVGSEKLDLEPEQVILVIARAINAAFNTCKWRMFIQQNPPAKVWSQLFTLYKIASKQGLLKTPVELFPLNPPTTLSGHFVQICMLGQLVQANLEKHEVEITGKLLRTWVTHADISNEYVSDKHLFFIDTQQDDPARRIRNLEPTSHYRYWELDAFEKQLMVGMTTTARGELPPNLMFAKVESAKKLNATFEVLHAEWRKEGYIRQRRKENREATSQTAKVKAGIFDISNQVLQANQIKNGIELARNAESLERVMQGRDSLKEAGSITLNSGSLDSWIITDQSKRGFGARINKYANIRPRKGRLIGLVIDGELDKAIIGTIRGVKPTQKNQVKVGIEINSFQAVYVQLQVVTANDVPKKGSSLRLESDLGLEAQTKQDLFSGVYLPAEKGLGTKASLLLPKINFNSDVVYTMYFNGKSKKVKLGTPIASEDDWVQVAWPI